MEKHRIVIHPWIEHDEYNGTGEYKEGCQITIDGEIICFDFNAFDRANVASNFRKIMKAVGVNAEVITADRASV